MGQSVKTKKMENSNNITLKELIMMVINNIEKLEKKIEKLENNKTTETKINELENRVITFEATQKEKLAANQRWLYFIGFIIMLSNAAMAWHTFFSK